MQQNTLLRCVLFDGFDKCMHQSNYQPNEGVEHCQVEQHLFRREKIVGHLPTGWAATDSVPGAYVQSPCSSLSVPKEGS